MGAKQQLHLVNLFGISIPMFYSFGWFDVSARYFESFWFLQSAADVLWSVLSDLGAIDEICLKTINTKLSLYHDFFLLVMNSQTLSNKKHTSTDSTKINRPDVRMY